MEKAFLKELKKLLPSGYKYIIVADRGFGNARFINNCLNLGFDYIIRTQANQGIEIEGDLHCKMSELKRKNFNYWQTRNR